MFPSYAMSPLNSSIKSQGRNPSLVMEVSRGPAEDVDIDLKEVYFLIMHFLSLGPCQRTYVQFWNELHEHQLLPRRYHAWYSRNGDPCGDDNDNGISLPLNYSNLVERYSHIPKNHLVNLLKQLLVCSSPPVSGTIGGNYSNAADVPTLLGSGPFSLLLSDKDKNVSTQSSLPQYLRWPHMHANQIQGLNLREIGGGFSRHHRAPSTRAACYTIAKPSTLVEKMQVIKKLRGHQNAVYCAIFDRTGRYVITGSDDRLVKIWSMETAFCLASCRGHEGDITDLAVSTNNTLVASASNDFIIRIWRLPDGLPISVLRGHTAAVTAIAFSPRPGSVYQLLSSSDDGTCRIWDARYSQSVPRVYTPKPPEVVPGKSSNPAPNNTPPSNQILCCAFNANGTVFVTGSADTYARVWNACKPISEDSELPNHEMDLLSGHENDVNYVQFSGCAVSSKFSVCDYSKEDNIPKFKNSWFGHDNIVTCSRDGSAIIWIPRSRRSHGKVGRWTRAYHLKVPPPPIPPQPSRGGPRQRFQLTPRGVNMIVWSLDNRFVLAAIMDCRICVWNASDGSLVHCLMGHSESTFVLDVHPFNPRIAMSAGYDGKTIIWDIWEGIPVRVYETGRFRLVDGKFSPDGTSVVLSDEVGQIFIIATGQGESQKDAKYDQFFLGDYRPLIQDAQGNVLDQETQLAPYRRNMQDLLCDSCMIPYPDPYQNIFQKRRLGALNIEWRPSSLKFAVGPSNNVNAADNHILAIADLDRWVEPVPEFLDAMDWEPEIEIQTDDADSEYNVTEEDSSDGGLESLGGSSSVDTEGSAEESEADHSHHRSNKEALRRSKRRKPKSEMELTTSSGRKVKRRNLDANEEAMPKKRKKQRRHGKLTSKKKSLKSKPHRPQRRAARNALSFLSQIGEASTEEEEDESETGSSDDDSALPDSNTQSNESDRSFLNSKSKQARGKEICSNEPLDASKSVRAIDSQTETGHRRRLVFKLPLRDPKRHISLEKTPTECIQGSFDASSSKDGNANKILSGFWEAGPSSGDKVNTQDNTGMSSKDIEYCENMINPSGFSSECHDRKIKWGEVKMRSSKRIRFGDGPMVDKSPSPTAVIEDQNTIRILENGCLKADDVQRRPPSTTSGANEFDHSRINSVSNHLANGVPDQLGEGSSGFVCKSLTDHPPMHSAASNERECIQGASDDVKNEVGYTNKAHQDLPNVIISQNSGEIDHQDMGADIVEYRSVDGHDMDHSNKVDTLGQPFFKKLRFTSKRPGNEASSSSYKVRPTESQNSSACTMLPNERTPMENILSVVHEEKGSYGSSDHGNHPESSNFLLRRQISQTKTANTKPNTGQIGSRFGLHDTEGSVSDYDDNGHQQAEFPNSSEHQFVRTRSTSSREVPDESTSTTNNFKSQDIHVRSSRNILKLSLNGHDQSHNDDRKSTSRSTVGLRSTRNRRETYNSPEFRPLDKRKSQCPPRKLSWLMLLEHEECYRYIPQLGDEVAYLRQGHEEYLTATHSNNVGPWKLAKNLRAVEFCKVIGMEYATLPGSGESCCKLTLEFIDPVSCELGKVFKFTLPELAEFPDFLVERMRYESSLERNWTNRDKCRVWWRNEDGEGGSWWEGRILYAKAKSTEFPDSPWEKYVIQYKSDSSGQHQHSPWELHDADTHWEHPHIDDYSIKKLLSSISKIEQISSNTKDTYGLQKLKQVSEKSEFLNRFPVPMSIEAVKQRLENKYYRNLDAVHHDIRVMLSNAETYFAKSAEYSSKIKKLSELVRREIFL